MEEPSFVQREGIGDRQVDGSAELLDFGFLGFTGVGLEVVLVGGYPCGEGCDFGVGGDGKVRAGGVGET